jgi:hypothetical protein
MLGYVHKDRALPHFQNLGFGVTQSEIEAGIDEHASLKLNPHDDKIMLNKSNLFLRAYAWLQSNPGHEDSSFATVLAAMLSPNNDSESKYAFAATLFMSQAGQMREEAAETYYKILVSKKMTVKPEMVADMLYTPTYHNKKDIHALHNRVAPTHGTPFVPGSVSPMPSNASFVPLSSLPQAPATVDRGGPSGVSRQVRDDDNDSEDSMEKHYIPRYERIKRILDDKREEMATARKRARRLISPLPSDDDEEDAEVEEPTLSDEEFLDDRDEDDLSVGSY